jgi:hypothetical protein
MATKAQLSSLMNMKGAALAKTLDNINVQIIKGKALTG